MNSNTLLNNQQYLTDSGLETTLVFHDGIDLPHFAAFTLLESKEGQQRLVEYFDKHIKIAQEKGVGFILESPTWRANPDWADRMGMNLQELKQINVQAIEQLKQIQAVHSDTPTLISGCIGPRGDGYKPEFKMTAEQARAYHQFQINVFAQQRVDMVSAFTMNYVEEAIGIVWAAQIAGVPAVISFTVETDGKLIDGTPLSEAISKVDQATNNGPEYYMVNCAHPSHFKDVLENERWALRIQGIRANSSRKSHEELDNSEELDEGNPVELGENYRDLQTKLKNLAVFGGCCGTDHRHIHAISHACF